MQTRLLRGTAVTELGFGGACLGNLYAETSDAEARLAVDTAWDGGVRYFDTAPHYGLGLSERRLGQALAELRDQGVIGAVGVGMNQWQAPLRMVRESDLDVVMLAGRWTLLDRSGAPLLAACAERGIAVIAAAPYNSGLLARDWPSPDSYFDYRRPQPEIFTRARGLAVICQRYGTRLPAAALQFPLRHPAVVSVVAGVRTAGEVDSALRSLAQPVPDAAWVRLAEQPGHGAG